MRNSKPSDNILSNKFFGVHVLDICQWFNFDPLGKVIRANQQIPLIPYCLKERAYNIQPPLRKRLRAGQRIEDSFWLVNV